MIIYKTTNLLNGKIYIGIDTHNDKTYFGSGNKIVLAIEKYGKENFVKDIIQFNDTFEELCESEIYWIAYFDSTNPEIGYNLHSGGRLNGHGHRMHDETKMKISEANLGRPSPKFWAGKKLSQEHKQNISKAGVGRVQTEETIKKISESKLGYTHSSEAKKKMSNSHRGKILSEAHKQKIRENTSKALTGRKKSEEHRKKLSIARKKYNTIKRDRILWNFI